MATKKEKHEPYFEVSGLRIIENNDTSVILNMDSDSINLKSYSDDDGIYVNITAIAALIEGLKHLMDSRG